jgi:hypothetical protein
VQTGFIWLRIRSVVWLYEHYWTFGF